VNRADCVSLGDELRTVLPELGEGASVWQWQQLRDHLQRWCSRGYRVVACCGEEGEIERFRELLGEDTRTAELPVILEHLALDIGVLFPDAHLVLLSDRELFGRSTDVRRRRVSRYRHEHAIHDETDLEEGAYAVHAAHGICRYLGIRDIEVSGELQEVLELEFDDEARLYVPLDQASLVSRYVGGTRKMPRLSKLGGSAWRNAREAAADAAWDLAAELLRIEAMRQDATGTAYKPALEWEHSFAGSFPYTETEDQADAIDAVLSDMADPKPMDRLLCGDVGYGKTEVAMRAAFRAVLNGKQVAVLVPTTVLAQQHYTTFRERMAEYPVEIDMVSRFRTHGEQRQILERVGEGVIDIIIGTHRLLQKDVRFADLGLLIIDEEQRFGVRHKQKLKQFRASVDILTMTATPIPRTLYLSLSGLRHLSTIMTAPAERLPVTTVVAHFDKELIRHAIMRELERQGQVYFLHNRVQTIDRMAFTLRQLLPEARIGVGHGQMGSGQLERVMSRFVRGEIDVLVCTTIIESGIDIPNANTIVIDRADRFGLAELYQLRGRVGRYHRQAYAYLLLPPMGALPENARQRLAAIRRYTHLGAGFKLALRDLEIRGAGNLLGSEQSGHIAAVGFDLYCQLLDDAVARLEHRPSPIRQQIPVELEGLSFGLQGAEGQAEACIPPAYMPSENARINSYKRLTDMSSLSAVDEFAVELRDRYGPPPRQVLLLLDVTRLRILARKAGIHRIAVRNGKAILETERGLLKRSTGGVPELVAEDGPGQVAELQALIRKHVPAHEVE
jgi:transcription-repair coupling factor (superfamily II helicase)